MPEKDIKKAGAQINLSPAFLLIASLKFFDNQILKSICFQYKL